MRAWEFLNESNGRGPPITVRHVNNVKEQERRRAASHQRRIERTRAMYANTAWQREQLELERMRLELEQIKAETDAIKAKARAANDEKISELARSGSSFTQRNKKQVTGMAKTEIHRQKKT